MLLPNLYLTGFALLSTHFLNTLKIWVLVPYKPFLIAQYLLSVISHIYNTYKKIEIDGMNPGIEQTLGKTMIAGNSNIINCSVHHYYCRESSLEPNSRWLDINSCSLRCNQKIIMSWMQWGKTLPKSCSVCCTTSSSIVQRCQIIPKTSKKMHWVFFYLQRDSLNNANLDNLANFIKFIDFSFLI